MVDPPRWDAVLTRPAARFKAPDPIRTSPPSPRQAKLKSLEQRTSFVPLED
jgi:hypothetical protein